MEFIYNRIFLEHQTPVGHPECPERLSAFGKLKETPLINGEEYIGLIHPSEHINKIRKHAESLEPIDADTFLSKGSFETAVHAVGMAVHASETNNFALIRPPGHHAHPNWASGFCLFNNIAIAVQKAVNKGKKVLIIDFDGHLGDGTLAAFYDINQVLFCSLHQFPAFPGGGNVDETGTGKGKGFSINYPLPPGSGDDIFMSAIRNFIYIGKQFNPDMVAVSAGFDACQHDPLLQLRASMNAYYETGKLIRDNFDNTFAVLEGGYNLEFLPKCAHNFLAGINGKVIPFSETPTTSSEKVKFIFNERIQILKEILKECWKFSE